MATTTDYLNAVKEVLTKSTYTYVPARENTLYELTFHSDGAMVGEKFTNWQLHYDQRKAQVQLRLLRGADFCVWLFLEKRGLWSGKDRHNGNCELRPVSGTEENWENLHDLRAFSKVEKEVGIPQGFQYYDIPTPSFDWSPYAWNINDLTQDRPDNTTAIAILAFNRPDYFQQVVGALASNTDIGEYPVFCFLDRPRQEAELELQRIQRDIVLEAIPHTIVIERPVNFGCGRNIIDARTQLFDNAGYERVYMFEDDGVPSSNYLRFTKNLMDWAESTYSNVGAVQGWRECSFSVEMKKPRLREVRSTYENWWGYLQNAQSWSAMREFVLTYQRLFLSIENYARRNHKGILEWQKLQTRHGRKPFGAHPVPVVGPHKDEQDRFIINNYISGQDGATMIGFYLAGFERLAPVVNRMKYIGERGIHKTPEFYHSSGYQNIILDEFAGDSRLKNFSLEKVM